MGFSSFFFSKKNKKKKKNSPTTFSSLAILGVQSRMVASDFSEIVCVGIEHAESPEWTPAWKKRGRRRRNREREKKKKNREGEKWKVESLMGVEEKENPEKKKRRELLSPINTCSMCCMMPQIVTFPSLSQRASTSISSARSRYCFFCWWRRSGKRERKKNERER